VQGRLSVCWHWGHADSLPVFSSPLPSLLREPQQHPQVPEKREKRKGRMGLCELGVNFCFLTSHTEKKHKIDFITKNIIC
jgi:hypothetical protein